jgi:hypothetical protein
MCRDENRKSLGGLLGPKIGNSTQNPALAPFQQVQQMQPTVAVTPSGAAAATPTEAASKQQRQHPTLQLKHSPRKQQQ